MLLGAVIEETCIEDKANVCVGRQMTILRMSTYKRDGNYTIKTARQPNHLLNSQVELQLILDFVFVQVRISIWIQQALFSC